MHGQLVVIRSFTGPLIRRVWEVTDDSVVAVTDYMFCRLEDGEDVFLIGFPPEDVFQFDGVDVPSDPNWKEYQQFKMI